MKSTNKEVIIFKVKDRTERYRTIKVVKKNKNIALAVQEAIYTRIRKNNPSIYENTPSREIKKWFESRRF